MDEFDEMNTHHMPPADSKIRQFYDKISELSVKSWTPLENKYYRLTQMGSIQLTETGKFNDTPSLSFMNYAQAKNGGPIGKLPSILFDTSLSHDDEI
jgi:hypothetical protein